MGRMTFITLAAAVAFDQIAFSGWYSSSFALMIFLILRSVGAA